MATHVLALPNNTASSWWNDPSLRRNVAVAFVCYWATFALGYDGSYMTGLQSMPDWNAFFDKPQGNKLGLISASSYLPSLVLSPAYQWMADRYGRRFCAILGDWIIIAGAFIGCFSNGLAMLILGRAIVGTGGFVMIMGSNLLANEVLHPRLRPIGSAFFLCFFYVGSAVSAWICFGVVAAGWNVNWGWRLPTLLQAIGPAIVAVATIFCPESPRWLVAKGRREEAHRVLANQHANGKLDDPLVLQELADIEDALEREKAAKLGIRSFFSTPGNRHRLIILLCTSVGAQLNGASVFSYYLAPVLRLVGVTSSTQQTAINGGLTIWNLIISMLGASFVDRIGRRKLWLTSTAIMFVSYCCLIGLSAGFDHTKNKGLGYGVIVFIFTSYGGYSLGWTPLPYPYTTEILPYSMRASGLALFIWLKNATLCFTQWVNPIGLAAGGCYFLFFAVLLCLLILIYTFFVETRGLTLEEIKLVFDSKDVDHSATPGEQKEAADAQVKYEAKHRHVEHLGRKISDEASV
ncbi:hypothetical protein JCM10295v2_006246 [Rhodotorula toruloides]